MEIEMEISGPQSPFYKNKKRKLLREPRNRKWKCKSISNWTVISDYLGLFYNPWLPRCEQPWKEQGQKLRIGNGN